MSSLIASAVVSLAQGLEVRAEQEYRVWEPVPGECDAEPTEEPRIDFAACSMTVAEAALALAQAEQRILDELHRAAIYQFLRGQYVDA